jgi:PTS system galactitol-specific IIB component
MAAKKRIYVCCGTGIATSTVISKKVNEMLKENNIAADISQCRITEVVSKVQTLKPDLVISSAQIMADLGDVPVIVGRAFLTGVNKQQVINQIIEILAK